MSAHVGMISANEANRFTYGKNVSAYQFIKWIAKYYDCI